MQIMKIDPDEKYVLLFPKISDEDKMYEIAESLDKFLSEGEYNLAFIYGKGIAIVPANQIIGYKVIEKENICLENGIQEWKSY